MGDLEMRSMAASIERLGQLPTQAAVKGAVAVLDVAKSEAAAGVSPTGQAWTPKKDGGRPLANAAAHLTARALGNIIQLTLKGVDVIHNFGTSRQPKRQIIPDAGAGIPAAFANAVEEAAIKAFHELLK